MWSFHMKSISAWVLASSLLHLACVLGSTIYVNMKSINGTGTGCGEDLPRVCAGLQSALNVAQSGDTILIEAGVYNLTKAVSINKTHLHIRKSDETASVVFQGKYQQYPCFQMQEDSSARIEGLHIQKRKSEENRESPDYQA